MLSQKTERLTPTPTVPERSLPPARTAALQPINHEWLREYEKQDNSIFKYYSVENEVDFLKKTDALPQAEREFYIEENVKRFLGEFVGKIPYTTIPYILHEDGLNYGGMHVMDSYRKAAEMGSAREKAETAGFGKIEQQFLENMQSGKSQAAVWISPPKIADYGFMFMLQPDKDGRVKEYIVRYDEKQEEVTESNRILHQINPDLTFHGADEFLLHPLFLDSSSFADNLPALLQTAGVSAGDIARSSRFETNVGNQLEDWIRNYTETVLEASAHNPVPQTRIDEAKSAMLAIYSFAERIRDESRAHEAGEVVSPAGVSRPLERDELAAVYATMQQNAPTITESGSCPAIQQHTNGLPGDRLSFISNSDMLQALTKGLPLENLNTNKTFPCPKCGYAIPSGEGRTSCPKCGITKEQYAKEKGGTTCD